MTVVVYLFLYSLLSLFKMEKILKQTVNCTMYLESVVYNGCSSWKAGHILVWYNIFTLPRDVQDMTQDQFGLLVAWQIIVIRIGSPLGDKDSQRNENVNVLLWHLQSFYKVV